MLKKSNTALLIMNMVIFLVSLIAIYLISDVKKIGAQSDAYMTAFTPAKYTFSIWMIIYFSSFLVNIYFFFIKPSIKLTVVQILLSSLNVLWVILWNNDYILTSWIVILALFVLLAHTVIKYNLSDHGDKWVKEYIYLYWGWISVATTLQTIIVVSYFVSQGFDIYIGVLAMLGLLYICYRFTPITYAYPLVIAWALTGIYMQSFSFKLVYFHSFTLSIAILVILLIIYKIYLKVKRITD